MSAKKLSFISLLIILITSICGTAEAKSVYAITDHHAGTLKAYQIQGDQLGPPYAQATFDEAVGVEIDSNLKLLFLTFESSNIVCADANALQQKGFLATPMMAGIVADEAKQKVYAVTRGGNQLYVCKWNDVNESLELIDNVMLADLSGAMGIALDKITRRLYIANETNIVHYYDADDPNWTHLGTRDVGRAATDIEIDSQRGYLYAGGFGPPDGGHTYLIKHNLETGTNTEQNIEAVAIGLAVDADTGLVYCTTTNYSTSEYQIRIYDCSGPNFVCTYSEHTGGSDGPAGICVESAPLCRVELTKVDDINDCVGPGDEINYTISYSYLVDETCPSINDVNIIDYLPDEVEYVWSEPEPNQIIDCNTIIWEIGTLKPGDVNYISLKVKVRSRVEPGNIITNYCELISGDRFFISASENTPVCCWKGTVIYVDVNATGNNDGTSWQDAYNYLQDALEAAWISQSTGCPYKEIRVANGTYKPDQNFVYPNGTGDRTVSFQLCSGITIKGGYTGYGAPDPNARDIKQYETILSGDLLGNDREVSDPCELLDDPCRADNSYHLVMGSDTSETVVLDGFIITAGNANGNDWPNYAGGGIFNYNSSPTIKNCTFNANSAQYSGGGMYNDGGNPTITNCIFSRNLAYSEYHYAYGGGLFNYNGSPTITDCEFTGNLARYSGGGLDSEGGNPTLINCAFVTNSAGYGGGIYNYNGSPTVTNCIFNGNSAYREYSAVCGGGIYNSWGAPTITNCTFSANSAGRGGGIYNCWGSPKLTNCILWGNSPQQIIDYGSVSVTYSDIQGGWPGTGNIDNDPCFVKPGYWGDVNDPNAIWVNGNYRLLSGSLCVDRGVNNSVPFDYADLDGDGNTAEPTPLDLDGFSRFIDDICTTDAGNGTPPIVDMGAYEFLRSDINHNGSVDFTDFALFALRWLGTGCGECYGAELTCDGQVEGADLREFVEWWLAGVAP